MFKQVLWLQRQCHAVKDAPNKNFPMIAGIIEEIFYPARYRGP
jgi:hypothetical protein